MSNNNEAWKLYLVMKNGRPYKGFIFESDADECVVRHTMMEPNDVLEVVPMGGDDLPFSPPPGAVFVEDGNSYYMTVGDKSPSEKNLQAMFGAYA